MIIRRIVLVLFVITLTACSVTKRLPEGSYLLTDNELTVTYPDTLNRRLQIDRATIKEYIPANQMPNIKVLGYNLPLKIYQLANPESESWGSRVIRKIGKAPIFFDSLANAGARRNLKLYMESEGFYNSKVTDTVIYKNHRAYVTYNIDAGAPYYISSYKYNFADSTVMPYVLLKSSESLISKGMILKRNTLSEERLRITTELQNYGFYYFSVGNIDYLVDTTDNKVNVDININQRVVDRVKVDHKRYRLGDIVVNPTSNSYVYIRNKDAIPQSITLDSIKYNLPSSIKVVKPEILSDLITIAPGDMYSKTKVNETRNRLNSIPLYRNVVVNMTERDDSLGGVWTLDCEINAVQELRQDFKVEFEASTNTNFSGLSLLLSYTNKNIFNGGETLNVGVLGGYDFMRGASGTDSWEVGGNVSFSIPRLLAPFNLNRLRSLSNISTVFEAVVNSRNRPYYKKTTTTLSYGYTWNSNKIIYSLRPINISLISVPWRDEDYIDSLNDYLKASYDSQVIAGSVFSLVYNNDRVDNRVTIRGNLETSGNTLSIANSILNSTPKYNTETNERYFEILGIRYSQYVRADLSFVYTKKLSEDLTLAYRLYGGAGYSYDNIYAMPVDRQFFAGGGSGMRGWQIRTLGPGTTPETEIDETYPDQLGDIKLETNLEIRFPLYDVLKGAVFFDLGNIWQNIPNENVPDKEFKFNNFYNQLGFNTGVGFRFDFDFFVIRIDWGIQLHNPNKPAGERWVINNFDFKNTALHFAIGYPF